MCATTDYKARISFALVSALVVFVIVMISRAELFGIVVAGYEKILCVDASKCYDFRLKNRVKTYFGR